MVVGICRLTLFLPGSRSLKDKRQVVRKLGDRLRAKFNAAIAEIGGQDTWQRAVLGFAVVGNEERHTQSMVDTITRTVEDLYLAQIANREVELLHYNENEPLEGE